MSPFSFKLFLQNVQYLLTFNPILIKKKKRERKSHTFFDNLCLMM